MSVNSTFPILNPDTPLAFLPPEFAEQFQTYRYVLVATAGMFVWEVITDTSATYRLVADAPFTLPTLAYILSRLGTMGYIIAGVWIATIQASNCAGLGTAVGVTYIIGWPATAFLFFLRVRAIWLDRPKVVWLFIFLWLTTLAGAFTLPFAIAGNVKTVGPTHFCEELTVRAYTSSSIYISTVYDTLVFGFISYRMVTSFAYNEGFVAAIRSFARGEGLPRLARSMVQGGQQYYLVAVITNIVALVPLIDKGMPIPYHVMLTFPKAALVNAMGCKVFRDVKFGKVAETIVQNNTIPLPNSGRQPTLSLHFGGRTEAIKTETSTDISHNMSRPDAVFSPYWTKQSATESSQGGTEDEWQMKTRQSNV